jgi:two-component system, LuxR family, sensor kinase FixL
MNVRTDSPPNRLAETLERAVLESAEQERRRIGQELHDHLSQVLLGAAFGAKALADRLPPASAEAAAAEDLARLVNSAVQQMRDLVRGLNSAAERDACSSRQK